ncbi:hypothetical protein [Mycoplasma nasistruthionis]|uniref:DUF4231 domain-containing protein n=1 Tax=Mycoplasma nasistruthionis TaxID=353852 RepID=A0A4Y6I573_9MOLU|nr:hypothetical protein [Mycoplasma nasistruthionis]QDF64746.1 hypothetical protein FIV53_00185 [Mycoplasma nasistruthionis]
MKHTNKLAQKIDKVKQSAYKKLISSSAIIVSLSILAILISSLIIVLNLYSIRYNEFPKQTMALFVALAVISVVITLIFAIQTFLAITNYKNKLDENVSKNKELIQNLKQKTDLNQEDIDLISDILND